MKLKTKSRLLSKTHIAWGSTVLLVLLSFGWLWFAKSHPDCITSYYSFGFYQRLIAVWTVINGWFSFSTAEVLLLIGVGYALFCLGQMGYDLCKRRAHLPISGLCFALPLALIFACCSVHYLPNYYRQSFADYSEMTVVDSSVDELYALCLSLADDANQYRAEIGQSGQVFDYEDSYTDAELFARCADAYSEWLAVQPDYADAFSVATQATAKAVWLSEGMSYLQITGFFFPITGEANINVNSSAIYIPATVCHELAHVAGFMQEEEANFIAYLVCTNSDEVVLQYSGTMLALLHANNALYRADATLYALVKETLSDDVVLDINAHSAYYNAYDTSIGDFSKTVNDSYLKANDQTAGVASYGDMVDLLLADFRTR